MKMSEIKNKLKKYNVDEIIFSKHVLIRCKQRNIDQKLIVDNIMNPGKMLEFQEFLSTNEHKYKLIFQISNARCLVVVITTNDHIEIITAWFSINKWERRIRSYDKG